MYLTSFEAFEAKTKCRNAKSLGALHGPNLDTLCISQLDAAPFCENYAKLYSDAKHLEKRIGKDLVKFLVPFFIKKALFLGQFVHCPNFLD